MNAALKDREADLARSVAADGDRHDYTAGMNRGRLLEVLRMAAHATPAPRAGLRELRDIADEAAAALHRAMIEAFPVGSEVTMIRNGHAATGICIEVRPRSLMVQFDPAQKRCEIDLRWFLEDEG